MERKINETNICRSSSSQEPLTTYKVQPNTRTLPVPKRHYQESLIRLGKTTASQESFHERDWVRKANKTLGQEVVLKIRKLLSGDMILRFKDEEGKEK